MIASDAAIPKIADLGFLQMRVALDVLKSIFLSIFVDFCKKYILPARRQTEYGLHRNEKHSDAGRFCLPAC